MTGRHGAVHPPREGAGQPFSVTCPESASRRFRTVPASSVETGGFLPACSIQGGNTTGVTHEAAKRWVPERSKTRIRRTGCGVEQFPCRRRARQRLHSVRGMEDSSPTQQWEEFPESPRAAPAPVRRGDGRRCIPRIRGADPGYSVESRSETLGVAPRVLPSETGDRGGPVGASRRIRGAGAPHRHTLTDNRGVTQGREHPVHRGPSGWMVAYAGSGTPGRRPAGVTAARPPCGGRSGFESRGGRRRPYDPLSDDPIRAVRIPPSDDGTLTALFHPLPRGRIDAPESERIPG